MEHYLMPIWCSVIIIALASPVLYFLFTGRTVWAALAADTAGMTGDSILPCAFISLALAFLMFLCGMYAAGLSRARGCSIIRAGGGYMISTALGFVLVALALFAATRAWGEGMGDDIASAIIVIWMLLQSIEVLVNLVMDIYRPRVAGVDPRPAYDSRLSGLLAEPAGLFRTFAHTMDYQFGFKISETWFFHFLEKALAPLIVVWLLTFYLLTCLVVVRPQDTLIIERFGRPRGLSQLPMEDAAWDRDLPAILGPGLHLKLPWPLEKSRFIPRESVETIYSGFDAMDEAEAEKKAKEIQSKLTSWDSEHVDKEIFYLMPMTSDMRTIIDEDSPEETRVSTMSLGISEEEGAGTLTSISQVDALMISGAFTLSYCIGDRRGDPYRYAYRAVEPVKVLRSMFEREITARLSGSDFWDVMVNHPTKLERDLFETVTEKAKDYGFKILSVTVNNLHPPAGDVGKSFQEVLAAMQKKEATILEAEAGREQILGLISGKALEITEKAESDRHRIVTLAKSRSDLFKNRLEAYNKSPSVFLNRARSEALAEALTKVYLVAHPEGVQIRLDKTRVTSPEQTQMFTTILGEMAKEQRSK